MVSLTWPSLSSKPGLLSSFYLLVTVMGVTIPKNLLFCLTLLLLYSVQSQQFLWLEVDNLKSIAVFIVELVCFFFYRVISCTCETLRWQLSEGWWNHHLIYLDFVWYILGHLFWVKCNWKEPTNYLQISKLLSLVSHSINYCFLSAIFL